ncbi:MAG: division/cell wall cluster transcriptional repressor MraZ [Anaerolineae bacterium]
MCLLGEHEGRLDAQGRLALPRPFLGALGMGCVVTRGLEPCLLIFPQAAWQELDQRIHARLPLTNAQARRFARHLFGGASFVQADSRGRVPLLPGQIEYASLGQKVTLVGMGTYAEVWNPKDWSLQMSEVTGAAQGAAEALTAFLS